jgi:hypothetical protein
VDDHPWNIRIVGHGEEPPDQLLANPQNWRVHPQAQQQALAGVIDDVGFVRSVTVNRRTGHVVDGHLRVLAAIGVGQPTIPVEYVDLSEAEEQEVLATLDPIGALAGTDQDALAALIASVETEDARVAGILDSLAPHGGMSDGGDPFPLPPQFNLIVECSDEASQSDLQARLIEEGYTVRAMTTGKKRRRKA